MQYRKTAYAANEFETYWFEKNLQGDIVAVYSEDGTKLISYTYDAWGNFTTTYSNGGAATTATYNPFTYRGYYYDAELELYYLNSRYYDSNTGRFINVDAFISTGQGLVACNMYAYCLNNSVMRIDFGGFVSYTYMDADETDDEYEGPTAMGGGGGNGLKTGITSSYSQSIKMGRSPRNIMNTVRRIYWKTEAKLYANSPKGTTILSDSGTYYLSEANLTLMNNGLAPIGIDGYKVNLHHYRSISFDLFAFYEITYTDHYSNFVDLHPWIYGGK